MVEIPPTPLGKGGFESKLSKGVGGFRSINEVNHTCVYTVAWKGGLGGFRPFTLLLKTDL